MIRRRTSRIPSIAAKKKAAGRSAAQPAAKIFFAVGDPTRRRMLDLLLQSERSVNELGRSFRMSQPAISQHLRILREADLVRVRRKGRQRLYRVNPKPVRQVYHWAKNYKELVDPAGRAWAVATPIAASKLAAKMAHGLGETAAGGFQVWLSAELRARSTRQGEQTCS
ncbi:MAG: metalloregulator ArsR/SmtB family transcription factor [Candidatus Acidiferrales bacterium]